MYASSSYSTTYNYRQPSHYDKMKLYAAAEKRQMAKRMTSSVGETEEGDDSRRAWLIRRGTAWRRSMALDKLA